MGKILIPVWEQAEQMRLNNEAAEFDKQEKTLAPIRQRLAETRRDNARRNLPLDIQPRRVRTKPDVVNGMEYYPTDRRSLYAVRRPGVRKASRVRRFNRWSEL